MSLRTELARRLAHVLPPTERPLGSSVVRDLNLCSGSIRSRLHILHVLLTLCNRRKLCVYRTSSDDRTPLTRNRKEGTCEHCDRARAATVSYRAVCTVLHLRSGKCQVASACTVISIVLQVCCVNLQVRSGLRLRFYVLLLATYPSVPI